MREAFALVNQERMKEAAKELRKARSILKIQRSRASPGGLRYLDGAIGELTAMVEYLNVRRSPGNSRLKLAFARAQYGISAYQTLKAQQLFERRRWKKAAYSLKSAALNLA